MAEVFRCGTIADIINDDKSEDKDNENVIKVKNERKLMKKFNEMIDKNKSQVIEIKAIVNTDEEVLESDEDNEHKKNKKEIKLLERKRKSAEKTERTAFVGNLPKDIRIKHLRQLFRKFGPIESIRFRSAVPLKENMSKKVAVITKSFHSLKHNINAYILYKSKDDVLKALELNGYVLNGHHIRVDSAGKDKPHNQSHSVFVGNLPFLIKEDELYDFFTECGDIEAVRVVRDAKTGVGKGFGFITFKSKDSVILAIERNDQKLNGRQLRVIRSKTESKSKRNSNEMKNNSKDTKFETKSIKREKKDTKFDSNPGFEGISAKKVKKRLNKKKERNELKTKRKQKKLSKIFTL